MTDTGRPLFHPKYFGLAMALLFFALVVLTAPYESGAPTELKPSWSAVRTVFGFLGGSGFTAWLSMTIYEYVTRRNQEREWKREFDIDLVKEIYGPIYDELKRNLIKMDADLSDFDWHAGSSLQMKWLSLLVPRSLVNRGEATGRLAADYNRIRNGTLESSQTLVHLITDDFLRRAGLPTNAPVNISGAEARYILGATQPQFKVNYENFLSSVEHVLHEYQLSGNVADLDRGIRASILNIAGEFLTMREHLKKAANELLAQLTPLISAPYKV